ncbi:MAG: cellulase family glycosylhydrolase [Acidobacteriia bacterium]|nr:cellulase family glycosylhydrolase [Terriglobia bacterium]
MRYFTVIFLLLLRAALAQSPQWTAKDAGDWYAKQPWLVGSNYIPNYAVNQLEMWQADSFDPDRIDMELGWAEGLGMNVMRVFLHDLLWQRDAPGFTRRIDRFLKAADKHKIRIVFVLFDSCWNPFPELGQQRAPKPGVHNSGWVQSPGAAALMDSSQTDRLLEYVKDVVAAFRDDKRVLAWDLWNEPDNNNESRSGEPLNKVDLVLRLLPRVFAYARAGLPTQPLTSGVWHGDWSSPAALTPTERVQLELSDVISFHNYDAPPEFEKRVRWLGAYNRPILCTEYMARPNGSTFEGILPVAKKYRVAAINWGLVAGKTQTWWPWDSWLHPYTEREPAVWFHDVFRADGRPYRQEEVNFIRDTIGRKNKAR